MTKTSGDLALSERSRNAYHRNLRAIRSLSENEFKHITIDIPAAVELALLAAAKARVLFEPLSNDATAFDPALPDRLESFSLALSYAHLLHRAAMQPPSTSEHIVSKAMKLREVFVADIHVSVLRGVIDRSVLTGLRGINGYRNLALDLRMLVEVFRNNRNAIAGRTTVADDELAQAESLASGLMAALAERDRAPGVLAQAIRDRNAAFALFVRTYDELRAAVGYLRRKYGDADLFAPTLFARRSLSKSASMTTNSPPGFRTAGER